MPMRYVVGAPQAALSEEDVRPGATAFPLERSSRSGPLEQRLVTRRLRDS